MYEKSVDVSNGHPYPLLNYVILKIRIRSFAALTPNDRRMMKRAEVPLKKQVNDNPPYNSPWCFFDLSVIYLITGLKDDALAILNKGVNLAADWEIQTHRDTLNLIRDRKDEVNGLNDVLALLDQY